MYGHFAKFVNSFVYHFLDSRYCHSLNNCVYKCMSSLTVLGHFRDRVKISLHYAGLALHELLAEMDGKLSSKMCKSRAVHVQLYNR